MLGGDIHVGVDSLISDSRSGLSIRHVTTSPITQTVSEFFNAPTGGLVSVGMGMGTVVCVLGPWQPPSLARSLHCVARSIRALQRAQTDRPTE